MSDVLDDANRVAQQHQPSWCEFWQATGTALCLQHATVWLPLSIGENDPEKTHGFCEFHAGRVIGAVVDQLEDKP